MLRGLGAILVLALAAMVVAGPAAPVQLSYATSDSMAPAISEGDLYFVIKGSSDISTGEVITFYSISRSDYVTHRVVEQTEDGYITKGDANPSTDQEAGNPVVREETVVGEVLTFGGGPLTIPHIGPAIMAIQSNRYFLIALVGALVIGDIIRERWFQGIPERDVVRVHEVVRPMLIMAAVACFVLIILGSSTHSLTYVATGSGSGGAATIDVGEPAIRTFDVDVDRLPFTTAVVDVEGVTVLDRVRDGSTAEMTVRVPPQPEIGPYRAQVHVRAYPATLPTPALRWLTDVHWFAAIVGSMVPIFGPILAVYLLFMDGRDPVRVRDSRLLRRLGGGGL